jgi:hypothetical protein
MGVRPIFLGIIIPYFFHQWLINNQGRWLQVDPCLPAVSDLNSTDKIKPKRGKE